MNLDTFLTAIIVILLATDVYIGYQTLQAIEGVQA